MVVTPSSVCSTCIASLPEQNAAPDCSDEPKEHVRQQHPDRVFHACDAAVALGVLRNVHLAKDTECDKVAEEDKNVDEEEEPSLEQGSDEEEPNDGAQGTADDSPDPFRVSVLSSFPGVVQIDSVERYNGDAQYELEEA